MKKSLKVLAGTPITYITKGETIMATVKNSKGNTGYTVTNWNFHNVMGGGGTIDLVKARGELAQTLRVQIAVQNVQVHSCGKKVMRLAELVDGTFVAMKGREFNPETPIYATLADAEQAARDHFEDIREGMAERQDKRAEMHENGVYQIYDWTPTAIAAHRTVAAMIRDGRIPLEIVYR